MVRVELFSCGLRPYRRALDIFVIATLFCSCRPSIRKGMPSLLLIVFFLQLSIHLVNTVGAPVINEFV